MAITRQDIEALSPREQEGLYREDARTAALVAKKLGTTPEEVLAAVRPDPVSVMKGFVDAVGPGLRGEYAPADPAATSEFGRAMAGAPQALRSLFPGASAVMKGAGEAIPEAYQQEGLGSAAAHALRASLATGGAAINDLNTLLTPSGGIVPQGLKDFWKVLAFGSAQDSATAPKAAAAEMRPRAGDVPEGRFQGDPGTILREIARVTDPAERAAALEAFRRQMGGALPNAPAASAPQGRTGSAPLAASTSQGTPAAPQTDDIDALSEYLKRFGDSQRALLASNDSKKALEAVFAKAGERPSSTDLTGKALSQALLFAGLRAMGNGGNMGPAMHDFTQTLSKGAERELLGKQDAYDTALKQALAVNTAGMSDAEKRFALEQSLGGAGMKIPELRHADSRTDKKARDEYSKAIAVAKIQAGRGPQTLREQVLDIESLSPAQLEILKSLKGDKTERKFDDKLYEVARTSLMEIKGITPSQADSLAAEVAVAGIGSMPGVYERAVAAIAARPKTGWFN